MATDTVQQADTAKRMLDVSEQLCTYSIQLQAMLAMTWGHSSFLELNEDYKERYLWACNDMADRICELATRVNNYICRQ